jgi:hypothetical protein
VINQTVGPGNTGDILYFTRVLMFISFLSMGYTMSQPTPAGNKEPYLLLSDTAETGPQEQEWAGLPLWQRKASEKAVERYAAGQEKKWHRWNEAMFERSG